VSAELMSTKELARYLEIHEKQVYALVKAGRIPATRVTGKWIFPRRLIDAWLQDDARSMVTRVGEKRRALPAALLAAGSNDPILDMLLAAWKRSSPEACIFSAVTGSAAGLRMLGAGLTDLAWSHLYDTESGQYNTQAVLAAHLPGIKSAVVHLFRRELGLLAAPDNPKGIRDVAGLAAPGVRIVNRQPGSGTRLLLDRCLGEAELTPDRIAGYDRELSTHLEVGLAVLAGEVDTGVATLAVARILGLAFAPLVQESFDMVVLQERFFTPSVQAFLDCVRHPPWRERVEDMYRYDFHSAGSVLFTNC
jgi:putative molybdopterin biosynthesis protein